MNPLKSTGNQIDIEIKCTSNIIIFLIIILTTDTFSHVYTTKRKVLILQLRFWLWKVWEQTYISDQYIYMHVFFNTISDWWNDKNCVVLTSLNSHPMVLMFTFKWYSTWFFGGFGSTIFPMMLLVATSLIYVNFGGHEDCPDTFAKIRNRCSNNENKTALIIPMKSCYK